MRQYSLRPLVSTSCNYLFMGFYLVYLIELILCIDYQQPVTKFYDHQILTTIINITNFLFTDKKQQTSIQMCFIYDQKILNQTSCFVQYQFLQDIFIYSIQMGQNQGKPIQTRSQTQNRSNQVNKTHTEIKKKEPKKQQAPENQTQTNLDPHQKIQENDRPTMSQIGQDIQSYQIENQQEDFFQGMGSYSGGDQTTTPLFEIRKQHTSAYNQYPFNTIVRVISVFEARPVENPRDFQFGSGVIITPRIIFTVAHNIWEKNLKISPDYVFVQPQSEEQTKKLIRVIKIGVHKAYFNLEDTQREKYDLAILILKQNDIIKPNMTMKLKNQYNHQLQKEKNIIVAGFPKDINEKNQNRFNQFYCELKIENTDKSSYFINYINATSGGQSGVPLILKFYNAQEYPEYVSIGLHKGLKGTKSYGILTTNDNTIEVAQLARRFCIMDSKNQQEIINKNEETLELQKEIQNLEKSKGQPVVELNNVVWKILRKQAPSLNSLVCKNDPESFRSAILKIKETFTILRNNFQLKNLVSEVVYESLFDSQKIIKSVFATKEQQDYLLIIEDYLNYCFDNKKEIKPIQFYTKIGERLYSLQNKLSFKRDSKEVDKDRELTLSRMQHKFIEKREIIIQNIKKRLSLPPPKQNYQKQQKILMEMNFLLKLNDFNKSQKYIDSLQPQDQNDRILLLKAELLYRNGNVKRSKIFFEKVKNSNSAKNKQSFQYTQAITKLGEIHRTRSEYVKCFEYFNQNMQIRKRMNPQEDTIEYAEALNNIATYDMDNIDKNKPNSKLEETVKKIKTALAIAEKSYGPNSIELVKYLTNLSMVYYSKSQISESLKHSIRALQIIKSVKGANSLETIEILNNIAAAYKNSKNNKKDSLDYYKKALEIQEMHRGKQSYYLAPILNNIAHLHLNQGKLDECETNLKRSIEIYEKFKTDNDATNKVGCGLVYFNLACFYEIKGKYKQAAQQAQKSHKLLKEADGSNHKGAQNAYDLWQACKNKAK